MPGIVVWRGDAQATRNVWHATPANVEIGDRFTLTINGKDITVTATAATVENVVDLFVAAIGVTEVPEWMEVTATAGEDDAGATTHVILTGPTDGTPLTITGSTADAGNLAVTITEVLKGDAGANEIQRITLAGNVTGGTFTLTFDGQTTGAIAYDASAATIQGDLEGLSTLAAGEPVVTGSAGGPWDVEFKLTYAQSDVSLLVGDGASLTKTGYSVNIQTLVQGAAGQNEKQQISLSATGGTFTLAYDGDATAATAFGASAATLQTNLEGIAAIGAGQVTVTGSAGGPWVVEFTGTLARTNVSQLVGDGTSLTGAATVKVATNTEGVDAIITLHLAYSPSLESAEVLAQSRLPVIMLDTTPDRDFGGHVDPMRLLDNHGIHGVQDLASVLRRLGEIGTLVMMRLMAFILGITRDAALALGAIAGGAAVVFGLAIRPLGLAVAGPLLVVVEPFLEPRRGRIAAPRARVDAAAHCPLTLVERLAVVAESNAEPAACRVATAALKTTMAALSTTAAGAAGGNTTPTAVA